MKTVDIRCPQCKHKLAEISEYGKVACKKCHIEVTVKLTRSESKTTIEA
jgi:DNA-directed RNA polymerase subunit RPC12/RpoP